MGNRIQLRHGSSVPNTTNLLPYELGWDGDTLYINNGATIPEIIAIGGANFQIDAANITGTLPVAHGGTGATSFTANSIIISGSTTTSALTTRGIVNNTTNTAITNNDSIPTMNTIYYGLAKINNSSQDNSISIYAPTAGGTAGNILISSGATAVPSWYNGLALTGTTAGSYNASFLGTTNSSSYTTGAVIVSGGIGIAGNIHSNGTIYGEGCAVVRDSSTTARKIYLTTTASVPSGAVEGDIVLVKV